MDNKEISDEPVDSCKRIINSKTVALAEQELNNQFESHGLNEVSFSPGYIANVYAGSLIWASSNTPSNQSPFSFAEVEPIRAAEQKNRHLTLQLILTQGQGMTVKEIKASNKHDKKRGNENEDAACSLVKNESPHREICMLAKET